MEPYERLKQAAHDVTFDLRQLIDYRHADPSRRVVRKTAPRLHSPVLNLSDYLEAEAQPPAAVHRSHLGNPLLGDSLGNADWGDCGEAMALHGVEAYHLDVGTPVPQFTRDDALSLYGVVGGFDPRQGPPGQNPTDQGTDNAVLVKVWEQSGIKCAADNSVHKIFGSVFVDPHDDVATRIAIWEFVVCYRAYGLPVTAQSQTLEWRVTDPSLAGDAAVGSWGYHDIPQFSYDTRRIRIDSWGEPLLVDWSFDKAYAVQGFVVVTPEQLNLRGVSPSGVNWTKLNADMSKFPPGDAS